MKITQHLAIAGVLAATGANAATHIVKAVAKPSFAFQPNTVNAKVGDYIEFHFGPANHSVAQGTFHKACQPSSQDGFFSGYLPVAEGENEKVFKILVENDSPFVFYCTQGQHCASGMYGVVNPNMHGSLETYKSLVSTLEDKKGKEPQRAAPFGGALIDNPSLSNNNNNTDNLSTEINTTTGRGGQSQTASATSATLTRAASTTFIPINGGQGQATGAVTNPSATNIPQAAGGNVRTPVGILLGAVGLAMLGI